MEGSGGIAVVASLTQFLHQLNVPLGGIPVGIGVGLLLYFVIHTLGRRPANPPSGLFRMTLEDAAPGDPATEKPTEPSAAPLVHLYSADGVRVARLRGAGGHPSVALPRAREFVAILVGTFTLMALGLLIFYRPLFGAYDHLVGLVGSALYWPLPWPGVYAVSVQTLVVPDYIFPMYLSGMIAFVVASGLVENRQGFAPCRRWFALGVILMYLGVELLLDALFFTVPGSALRDLALLVRALTGGLFLALLMFCAFYLPQPQSVEARFPRDRAAVGTFVLLGMAAVALSAVAILLALDLLRIAGVLFAFTLLLLLPVVALPTFCALARPLYFRRLRSRPRPSVTEYHPSVSILIPAFNEEELIAEVIQAADRAAARYPGPVEIIVGNDGSRDRTLELARGAVAQLRHCRGTVVDMPHGGKSNALNGALAIATGEIVLRCDGDTIISETPGFAAMIPHFADPKVGGVQGGIHPRRRTGWTWKLRALEIAWMHYMLRPAQMGTRSAEVIDGLFSAFRRQDLIDIGGYVPWNGEDTEVAIHLQRLGFEIRIEFGALAYEDVPATYDDLRRQRVRWARGIWMANGQHYESLFGATPEFAGLGVLFWFLLVIRSGVRSLAYIFLAALILVLGVPALEYAAVLLAIALVIRAVPLGYFLVKMGRPDVLPWILFFPFGNILKQTFRFEAFGTLGPNAAHEYV
ncbi:MAG: glycosyltransferase family 2 protein [Thermoplasmata archaeon]|nr:glycosyltransferase family 2 protein [Thermoplasmata archaeon]